MAEFDFYDFLIDLALQNKDYDWVKELKRLKEEQANKPIKEPERIISEEEKIQKQIFENGYSVGYLKGVQDGMIQQYNMMMNLIYEMNKKPRK